MKIDDPRLEKARKEMAERVEKYNALLLSVIKTHLVVEQAMDGLQAAWTNPLTRESRVDSRLLFAESSLDSRIDGRR